MVNVNCAGRQDKATTTSETHPYIPPSKTRNCYTNNDGPAPFDNSLCGTANDKACTGKGGINACKPDNYGGYCKVGNQYYLVTNSKLGINGKQRTIKIKQPLTNDVNVGEKFTFVEKRLPNYRDRVRLEPFTEVENDGIFLRLPNLNSVENPINFQGTNYGTH